MVVTIAFVTAIIIFVNVIVVFVVVIIARRLDKVKKLKLGNVTAIRNMFRIKRKVR